MTHKLTLHAMTSAVMQETYTLIDRLGWIAKDYPPAWRRLIALLLHQKITTKETLRTVYLVHLKEIEQAAKAQLEIAEAVVNDMDLMVQDWGVMSGSLKTDLETLHQTQSLGLLQLHSHLDTSTQSILHKLHGVEELQRQQDPDIEAMKQVIIELRAAREEMRRVKCKVKYGRVRYSTDFGMQRGILEEHVGLASGIDGAAGEREVRLQREIDEKLEGRRS